MWKWFFKLWNSRAIRTAEEFYSVMRQAEGERRIGNVNIVGNNLFRDEVAESLARLKDQDPYGYSLVQRYIRGVVAVPKPISFGYLTALCFEVPGKDGSLPWSPDRFAGVLLRTALDVRFARGYNICLWLNPKAQLPALRRELECLRALQCHPTYITQQEDFIAAKARKAIC
jgi:hypothetical protein